MSADTSIIICQFQNWFCHTGIIQAADNLEFYPVWTLGWYFTVYQMFNKGNVEYFWTEKEAYQNILKTYKEKDISQLEYWINTITKYKDIDPFQYNWKEIFWIKKDFTALDEYYEDLLFNILETFDRIEYHCFDKRVYKSLNELYDKIVLVWTKDKGYLIGQLGQYFNIDNERIKLFNTNLEIIDYYKWLEDTTPKKKDKPIYVTILNREECNQENLLEVYCQDGEWKYILEIN